MIPLMAAEIRPGVLSFRLQYVSSWTLNPLKHLHEAIEPVLPIVRLSVRMHPGDPWDCLASDVSFLFLAEGLVSQLVDDIHLKWVLQSVSALLCETVVLRVPFACRPWEGLGLLWRLQQVTPGFPLLFH